ncbi:metallophosphoesterase family protein [Spirulina major CS-329]|uniref:metallophosphoesterase family protein n=1 Tax=Spirulina TaxID=1154 RepID=UPI00232B36EB|nr:MULTISPECIES: metallophosphoesterase family protein [Spirulina]MDB9496284.1 metallophosphoesterase family protein [Spirulina subsalsa CS-330]MDB9502463.1 metallophosphoesterase family protein [Spirulina major CS-329]
MTFHRPSSESESQQRRIFIGDVHGHYDALMILLEAIAPSRTDQVYFVGDLVDRGPKSAQVVEFVKSNRYHCLLGNHEQMLLDVIDSRGNPEHCRQAWLYSGGNMTLNSYGSKGVLPEHIEWMRSLPTHLDLGDVWLVHAGVDPRIPIEKHTAEQFCWIRDEFHSSKEPFFKNKLIITGHTITFTLPGVMPGKLAQGPGWLDIDTGAYHRQSGWLTGLDLTRQRVYQVNARQHRLRTLDLAEAVTTINPNRIFPRRMMMR